MTLSSVSTNITLCPKHRKVFYKIWQVTMRIRTLLLKLKAILHGKSLAKKRIRKMKMVARSRGVPSTICSISKM